MSSVEILHVLRQLLEQLVSESVETVPSRSTETVLDQTVGVQPVETNPIDCRAYRTVTIYIVNTQDVDVTVEFYGGPDGVNWARIAEPETVSAGSSKAAVLVGDYHPFIKLRAYAASSPSTGKLLVVVAKYAA